jgi:hypothetical protein
MRDLIWFLNMPMRWIERIYLMFSWNVFMVRNDLRWRDDPREDGPLKAIHNRFGDCSPQGCVQLHFRETWGQRPQSQIS